ncbi:MAG: putative branched-chain amino acid aminotransferase [Firmicutes bacterium]|nr:putative branched-chain amino acid aminotransferase [Bacillota bacterium]
MYDIEGEYFLINGEVKPVEDFDAKLVTKGRPLYEVIRVMDGKPLFYSEHIARLHNSARLAGTEIPVSDGELRAQVADLLELNRIRSGNFKIIFSEKQLCVFKVRHKYPDKIMYESGVDTVLYHGERKNPNIKAIDTVFRSGANEKMMEKNAYEAILVDKNGFVTEGSRSNIFMIMGETVITSPVEDVLPGITRDKIIEISKKLGYRVMEKKVSYLDLEAMDGLFISGTSPEVLPIRKVDDLQFDSQDNKVIRSIMGAYHELALEDAGRFSAK